jgi:hypothetical protein
VAKASRKSTSIASGKLSSGSATIAGKGSVAWTADARFAGAGKLDVDARKHRWKDISDSGRPSSKNEIVEHARHRLETNDSVPKLKKQFDVQIHEWLIRQRALDPKLPAMSLGRVQKALRADKKTSALWRTRPR